MAKPRMDLTAFVGKRSRREEQQRPERSRPRAGTHSASPRAVPTESSQGCRRAAHEQSDALAQDEEVRAEREW